MLEILKTNILSIRLKDDGLENRIALFKYCLASINNNFVEVRQEMLYLNNTFIGLEPRIQ